MLFGLHVIFLKVFIVPVPIKQIFNKSRKVIMGDHVK